MPATSSEPVPPYSAEMHTTSSSETSLVRGRPKTMYFHGGIGGAGNYHKVIRDDTAEPTVNPRTHQPRRSHLPRSLTGLFSSGVGGAGNMHARAEEPALTPDEERARARIHQSHGPKRWFVGIGGMGNLRSRRQQSPSSHVTNTTNDSDFSNRPPPIGAAEALRRKLLGERSH